MDAAWLESLRFWSNMGWKQYYSLNASVSVSTN